MGVEAKTSGTGHDGHSGLLLVFRGWRAKGVPRQAAVIGENPMLCITSVMIHMCNLVVIVGGAGSQDQPWGNNHGNRRVGSERVEFESECIVGP